MLKSFLEDTSQKNEAKKMLYKHIHKKGKSLKKELLKDIQVPSTTLTRMLQELEQLQVIRIAGYGSANGGRPPIHYEANASSGYLVGIDIARTHITVILFNVKLEEISHDSFSLTKEFTPEVALQRILTIIQKRMSEFLISSQMLIGIGIGAVGPLDREAGIISSPEAFPAEGWTNVRITERLKQEFDCKILLNNGADMAALAEYSRSKNDGSILYSMSGYGIRCGYINNGLFLNHFEGDSSSYGHVIVQPGGKECSCGKKGCLAAYSTLPAIFKAYEENPPGDMESLLKRLNEQDDETKKIVEEAAYYYGIGIANFINILHPEHVILHGRLIYQSDFFYQLTVETAKKYMFSRKQHVHIKKGNLEEKAVAIGAAIQVFNEY